MIINKNITPIHPDPSTHLSNPSIHARMNHFFRCAILAGFVSLAPTLSSAAPPEHANERAQAVFSEDTLPENARSKRMDGEEFARGRILIMPRAGLPAQALANILKEHEGKPRKIGQSDLYIVDLPEYTEEGVLARLAHHPHLKFAELDYIFYPELIPNDPYYGNAWHLTKIGAPTAWNSSQGAGVTIAILDTGVDGSHPDLSARILPGWNFYNNNSNTSDVHGHGTAVAGAAAATSNNGKGVTSISGQSKIMPIRISSPDARASASTVAQGITWAVDKGARVANISFSGLPGNLTVQNAAQYMKNKGGLVVVAAGNSGKDEGYASTTTMIPVSATNSSDVKTSWSSYGKYVALSAPGIDIWTTFRYATYGTAWGTSLATPITAGTIALMMAANSKLNSTEIEKILFSTAKDLGSLGRDNYYGYGRVNAAAAVQTAISASASTATSSLDSEIPTVTIANPLTGSTVSGLVPVDIDTFDNVEVIRAELWINGTNVAIDSAAPFAFTWDSTGTPNGTAKLAVRVSDIAGNIATSDTVEVMVSNQTTKTTNDTTAPQVSIINPVAGTVTDNVSVTVNASDDSESSGITLHLYIDGSLVATGTGSTLGYNWNTRPKRIIAGMHQIEAIARDAAGNSSSTSVNVTVIK